MDFNWLLEKLTGQIDNRYWGCEVNVPETVMFKDGRPSKVIRTESNGFVTTVKTQLTLSELKKHLLGAILDRNREVQRLQHQM
jgi:hypothetical protein